jgi:hypothetical protein
MVMNMLGRGTRIAVALCVAAPAACARSGDRVADSAATNATTVGRSASANHPDSASPGALIVTPFGIGPVRAGMSPSEAESALGAQIAWPNGSRDGRGCTVVSWRGAPAGVHLMIENGKVARVDVDSATVATADGIRVGSSEAEVRSAYGSRLMTMPHKYEPKGHYLVVTPASAADSLFRLVFETDGQRVTRYRSGRLPAVQYVERCG